MQPWIRRRAKRRKDGRLVVVTTVVMDAEVLSDLCKHVLQPRLRSTLISDAVHFAMASPGWLESATARANNEEIDESGDVPSSKSAAPSSRKGSASSRRAPLSKPASSKGSSRKPK